MAVKETGIKRTEDGGVFCEHCGADLRGGGATKFIGHFDGAKSFVHLFECDACGGRLMQEHEYSVEA